MKVLYFAQAGDAAGCREEHWDVDGPLMVDEFWAEAVRRHPGLAALRTQSRIASNLSYLSAGNSINPDQEVAVIPPVSGG